MCTAATRLSVFACRRKNRTAVRLPSLKRRLTRSHATLQELDGWKWNGYRLSLGGTSHVALFAFLERHPEIRRVDLYLDNDYAGLRNARKIQAMLRDDPDFKHIRVGIHPPREGKDYNEMLQIRLRLVNQNNQRRREKTEALNGKRKSNRKRIQQK